MSSSPAPSDRDTHVAAQDHAATMCWYCGQPERWWLTRKLFGRRLKRIFTALGPFPACSRECAEMVRLGKYVKGALTCGRV